MSPIHPRRDECSERARRPRRADPSRFVSIAPERRNGRRRKLPRLPLLDPEDDEQRRDGDEVAEREVRVDRGDPVRGGSARRGTREAPGRGSLGARASTSRPIDRSGEADREEPVLEVQRDRVRRPHRVERAGLDRRQPGRIRRGAARSWTQEVGLEPPDDVELLRLRHPERPAVPLASDAREAVGAEEALEVDDDPGDEEGARRARCPGSASRAAGDRAPRDSRRRPTTTPATTSATPLSSDRPAPIGNPDDQLERHDDHQRRDAEEVGDAGEPDEVRPPAPAAHAPEHACARRARTNDVEDEEAGDRADGHERLRAKQEAVPGVGEHLVPGPSVAGGAAVAEDPRRRLVESVWCSRQQKDEQEVRHVAEVGAPSGRRPYDDAVRRRRRASTGARPP